MEFRTDKVESIHKLQFNWTQVESYLIQTICIDLIKWNQLL